MTTFVAETGVLVLPNGKLAFTLKELPNVAPWGEAIFRKATRKPKDDGEFPHPLKAHRDSKGKTVVLATDLQRWLERLPDL